MCQGPIFLLTPRVAVSDATQSDQILPGFDFETYTALLQPLQRLKLVPSFLASLHSQQTEPAIASNGRATGTPSHSHADIAPSSETVV